MDHRSRPESPQTSSSTAPQIVYIGAPAWTVLQPFHSLLVVGGMAKEAGFNPIVYDLNIDLYNRIKDEGGSEFWSDGFIQEWAGDVHPRALWDKYARWLTSYLDRVLEETSPAMFGFTINFVTRWFSQECARYLKSKRPDIPVMFGGVDCFPKEQNASFLSPEEGSYCDIICQGESEIAYPEYLAAFRKSGDWKTQVPGFVYYDGEELINTGITKLPGMNVRQPRPAMELFDFSKYLRPGSAPFQLSRGCPYTCGFCSESPNFWPFRFRDPEDAIEELKEMLPHLQAHTEVPTLNLSDSNLNVNVKLLGRFVDLLLENDIKITWGGQAHLHKQVTRELLVKMKKAGFAAFFWGVETESQNTVNAMKKAYKQEDLQRILRTCNELGINSSIPIIIGYPGEMSVDVVDSIDLIFTFKDKPYCHVNAPSLIMVRSNAPLYEEYEEHGLANQNYRDWSTSDGLNTLPVRIGRRFITRQAWGNPNLTMEGIVDKIEIHAINLSQPIVANDMFEIVFEMCRKTGKIDFLEDWLVRAVQGGEVNDTQDRQETLRPLWHQVDKRSDDGKDRLFELILQTLVFFKDSVDTREAKLETLGSTASAVQSGAFKSAGSPTAWQTNWQIP